MKGKGSVIEKRAREKETELKEKGKRAKNNQEEPHILRERC